MATYSSEPQLINKFLGIRELNGVNSGGAISATRSNNVEFYQSEIGNCTGIKTQKGNAIYFSLNSDYKTIACFESIQDGDVYIFIYAENDTQGALYVLKPDRITPSLLIEGLSITGECNGLTMTSSAYDVFVFTNGQEQRTISFTQEPQIRAINAIDYQNREIKWLSMCEWSGFLVVASKYGVHASHQNDIYTWNDNPTNVADSWYIDYSNKVTAVASTTTGLFIFTNRDCSFLNTTPNDLTNAIRLNVSMNGTLSHTSFCIHDLYLFFYDAVQKNIYQFGITDSGQVRPIGPMAKEIQSYFQDVKTLKMTSCIYGEYNQLWVLINDESLLIFDYLTKEWTCRAAQKKSHICYSQNHILTCSNDKNIYVENVNYDFNGNFYHCEYKTCFINLGSNTNLKKEKTPLLLVLSDKNVNNFYVELTCNGKVKNSKLVQIIAKGEGVYALEGNIIIENKDQMYDEANYTEDSSFNKRVVEISTPQTWYTLGVRFFTQEEGQGFCIDSMELKNIKVKTKTKGR